MARIKRNAKATSLAETIVAALILLVTFMITMETLSRLMVREGNGKGCIDSIAALQQCRQESLSAFSPDQPEIQEYEWGELQVSVTPYAYGLYQVTLKVKLREGGREIEFTYLKEE